MWSVFYIGFFAAAVCGLAFAVPKESLIGFMFPTVFAAVVGFGLLILLFLLSLLSGYIVTRFCCNLLIISGLSILASAFIGFVSPTYFGAYPKSTTYANDMILLEIGICYAIAGLDCSLLLAPKRHLILNTLMSRRLRFESKSRFFTGRRIPEYHTR